MSQKQWLMIVGALIMALPFLGFPSEMDTVIFVILGFIIVVVSYHLNSTKITKGEKSSTITYIEQRNDRMNINSGSKSPINQ